MSEDKKAKVRFREDYLMSVLKEAVEHANQLDIDEPLLKMPEFPKSEKKD